MCPMVISRSVEDLILMSSWDWIEIVDGQPGVEN
jgi:hypothetical protein